MSLLASLLARLAEKREDLRRLNACEGQLGNLQGEFVQNRMLVEEPELTAQTWKGVLANEFLDIRDKMAFEYDDISNSQISRTLELLRAKIGEVQREIEVLQARIAAERARLARERDD
ncbi:YwqH-like family protein [Oceanobacillus senegalensis]|uniref:YwqH-like family protein n=1 Tax=Oceanobacillus senegalensis TaxID=1936063 RepID=UPI000A30ECD6|nr:hypothetical protein [Oceanobacillus senegalensis]